MTAAARVRPMERNCSVLINGRPCALPVKPIHGIETTFTVMHICPLGHRCHFFVTKDTTPLQKLADEDIPVQPNEQGGKNYNRKTR